MKGKIKDIIAVVLLLGCFIISFFVHPAGLSQYATRALLILIMAVILWIFKIIPEFVTAILMACAFVLVCNLDVETVFSGFAGSTWWLMVAVLTISAAVSKSGLLNRIGNFISNLAGNSYYKQVAGMIVMAVISSPFIPNIVAKAAVFTPFAKKINDSSGYRLGSNQSNGLFLSLYSTIRITSMLVISGSTSGLLMLGFCSEDVQQTFSYFTWFINMLPWASIMLILSISVIVIWFKPEKIEAGSDSTNNYQQKQKQTSMTREEIIVTVVMVITLFLWIFSSSLGIPVYVTSLLAICVLVITGVLDKDSFSSDISWDFIILLGIIISIASVFSALEIDTWLMGVTQPYLIQFINNPYLLLCVLSLICTACRFLITSEYALISIMMPFLISIAEIGGYNPWVLGITMLSTGNPWILPYQNNSYMMSLRCAGDMIDRRKVTCFAVLYQLFCVIAIIICVPIWKHSGLI